MARSATKRLGKRRSQAPVVAPGRSTERIEREDAAIACYKAKRKTRAPFPSLKLKMDKGVATIGHSHSDLGKGGMLLTAALGGGDYAFSTELIKQLAFATGKGSGFDEHAANFLLSTIAGMQPTDEVETMLLSQMAITQTALMTFARRLNHVDNIPQQDSASNAFNKLARTFTGQIEAFKRYRTGGEQRVTVQHVNVSDGGQAIVGDVLATPRRREGEG